MGSSDPQNNALVTGGTQGIGKAVTFRFARQGLRVTCVYRSDEEAKDRCARELSGAGLTARFERADLSSAEEVRALFERLARTDEEPSVLVNAAGMTRDAPLAFTSEADLEAVLAANLKSTFWVCREAQKTMVRRRFGRIVNFTSPAALLGNEGQSAYAAAKGGILGFTRSLARELGRFGITVNAVCPGLVETGLSSALSPKRRELLLSRTPLGRAGTPEEVAGMVWMISQKDAGTTGQCLAIDGGLT